MNEKWTPGPWGVEGRWLTVMASGAHAGPIYEISDIVTSTMGSDAKVEDAANLALIAAAPDLYEALERAREELRLIRMKDTNAVYDTTLRIGMDMALAKARGEETSRA